MTNRIIKEWITTTLGLLIGIFGGFTLWFEKTTLFETIPIWVIAAIFIAAKDSVITKLVDFLPKSK